MERALSSGSDLKGAYRQSSILTPLCLRVSGENRKRASQMQFLHVWFLTGMVRNRKNHNLSLSGPEGLYDRISEVLSDYGAFSLRMSVAVPFLNANDTLSTHPPFSLSL